MLNSLINNKIMSDVNGTFDVNFWATGTIEPWLASCKERPDPQKIVDKAVQKYKVRFKEAWEELSDR
ncbi:MAG: hypothetical protein ACOZF2_00025 [Thermodesulfobacteriota bacterium]